MTTPLVLTNARIVTRTEEVFGTVVVDAGTITAVDSGRSQLSGAVDLDGDYLLPGLIEIHTDNAEKHIEPRNGVHWPYPVAAVLAHDTQIIGAGITTVMDAIAIGEFDQQGSRRHMLAELIAAIRHAGTEGLLKARHLLHLRCELTDPCVLEMLEPHIDNPLVRLISLMDHTPGQRQYRSLDKYREAHRGRIADDAQLARVVEEERQRQARYVDPHRRAVVALARDRGIPLASHDDATLAHVDESLTDGCVIAEFPVTLAAAMHARAGGMATVMGAPNVVRGGSHSGNLAATDLLAEGALDGLSSDYVPLSLMHAPFLLAQSGALPLPDAVALVSANLAALVGLNDRGQIAPGLKADLARVHVTEQTPCVRTVWREGVRVC